MYTCIDDYVSRQRLPSFLEIPRARTNLLQCALLTRALRTLNVIAQQIDLFSCSLSVFTLTTYQVLSSIGITSRIVAESGIASDRFHLGKIILQCLKDDPNFVMQIDGATGLSETNGSVLKRTIKCATSLKNFGLKKDDVMVLMAPNHLDLAIPFYAGWYLGLAVAPTDRTLNNHDLKNCLNMIKPNIVFCQSEKVQMILETIELLKLETKIVSFDKSTDTICLSEMLENCDDIDIQEFNATNFDPETTTALLVSTSGTTGLPKVTVTTHKNMAIAGPYVWSFSTKFPSPIRSALLAAPIQWLSSIIQYFLGPVLKYTRVQTSAAVTCKHLVELISRYKPAFMIMSPTMLTTVVKTVEEESVDFSTFELIFAAGSSVSTELVNEIKTISPKTIVQDTYGMSELTSLVFQCVGAPPGSCGKRIGHLQYRLIDVETKDDIKVPNKCGELWLKGPGVFKAYYNNPKATADAFTDDWFMTGDLMYRDENWNFYYVDRIKLLLKYKNHQISPVEVETVIRQHPGVLDVAVTGVPDPECGDLTVACVVPRPGCNPTKQEIKDLVKDNLSDSKQLRGGVIFLPDLPLTSSTKIHRQRVKQIVIERLSELDCQRD